MAAYHRRHRPLDRIMELAQRLRDGKCPRARPSSLDVDHATKETGFDVPNGCHVAEVEIDPETA